MHSIQQLIKALRKLQNSGGNCVDLVKSIKHVVVATSAIEDAAGATITTLSPAAAISTSLLLSAHCASGGSKSVTSSTLPKQQQQHQQQQQQLKITNSSQQTQVDCQTSQTANISLISHLNESSSTTAEATAAIAAATTTTTATTFTSISSAVASAATKTNVTITQDSNIINSTTTTTLHHLHRSQQIQNFYQQQLHHFHTQHNQSLYAKQKQTQANAMSSLAAEPLTLSNNKQDDCHNSMTSTTTSTDAVNIQDEKASTTASGSSSGKPCFNTGLGEILQFMELIGNLKHTKRTGWVLRDVNDCESISGHMYRMSMMTFLLDGTEGLNQIRCMQLALVHDLAESLVGDITPFCGVSKEEKRAMEFKAMEDICKLIEPRGKRIMELFEEYEHGQSAESRFVKDLDRLDMVMQAFEYEKRDNCLLKHQEFFDSTAGKFNHPFVKKLVDEIYEQRKVLAKAKGATPPPVVNVPNMDLPTTAAATNGQVAAATATCSSSSSS